MNRLAIVLATWFGVGLLPRAPGTWASLAALPVAWLLSLWGGTAALLVAAALVFAAGSWAAGRHARVTGLHDSPTVVIDEVAAQWLAVAFVPPSIAAYAVGFLLFRAADIAKPWPAGAIDRYGRGGVAVMLDDVAAALYAAPFVYLTQRFLFDVYAA